MLRDRDTDDNDVFDERLYALQDGNWNVTALCDETGSVQEHCSYSAYGVPTVLDASFAGRSASSYDWEIRYAGYRWDAESEMQQVRNRYLHAVLGKWISRDPVGYEGSQWNLHEYVSSIPVGSVDPSGNIPVETGADVICTCTDFYNLCADPSWENAGWFCWSAASCFVPYVPGSYAGKACKYGKKVCIKPKPAPKPPKNPNSPECKAKYTAMKATCAISGALGGCVYKKSKKCKPMSKEEYHKRELAYMACALARQAYQMQCWTPKSDPKWEGHMKQIGEMKAAATKCKSCATQAK